MIIESKLKLPRTKKGKETCDKIIKAAEKLFDKNSYPATSISDIALEAKVAVGTFYLYFESKKDLFRHLVLTYFHDIRKQIAISASECKTRLEMEKAGFRAFYNYIFKNRYAYTIIWQSLVVDKPLFIYYYTSFAEKYCLSIKTFQKQGEIKEELDPMNLAYSLMGITNFIGLQLSLFNDHMPSKEEIEKSIDCSIKMLSEGMFTSKGLKE